MGVNVKRSLSGMSSSQEQASSSFNGVLDEKSMSRALRVLTTATVRDRTYHLRTYRQCFVGQEVVSLLVDSGCASNRSEAVTMCKVAQKEYGIFQHVVDEHKQFEDAYLFFRFKSKSEMENTAFSQVQWRSEGELSRNDVNSVQGAKGMSKSLSASNGSSPSIRSQGNTCRRMSSVRVMTMVTVQSWDLLRSFLSTHAGRSNAEAYGLERDRDGRTPLHLACHCRDKSSTGTSMAPLDIIELLLELSPDSVKTVDSFGRTPLHLAAASCAYSSLLVSSTNPDEYASWKVLSTLLGRHKDAASMKDKKGKTPLILLAENLRTIDNGSKVVSFADEKSRGRRNFKVLLSIVKLLCDASPETVNDVDERGKNALEYARIAEADPKILQALCK